MAFRVCMLFLVLTVAIVSGQRRRPEAPEWNYRDGSEKVNIRGVANLTQVLDNWRFDILSQMTNQLQNDHQSLLPDYSKIQPLSEALNDLYKEFNSLKTHLGDLSEKVVSIETFIDEVKAEKLSNTVSTAASKKKIVKKKAPGPAPAAAP